MKKRIAALVFVIILVASVIVTSNLFSKETNRETFINDVENIQGESYSENSLSSDPDVTICDDPRGGFLNCNVNFVKSGRVLPYGSWNSTHIYVSPDDKIQFKIEFNFTDCNCQYAYINYLVDTLPSILTYEENSENYTIGGKVYRGVNFSISGGVLNWSFNDLGLKIDKGETFVVFFNATVNRSAVSCPSITENNNASITLCKCCYPVILNTYLPVTVNCPPSHGLSVVKKVKVDGCGYGDFVSFDYGDYSIVSFKLFVNVTGSLDYLNVTDCLPSYLSYVSGSARVDGVPSEPSSYDNCIYWVFGSGVLADHHYVITFDASVTGCGSGYNHVNVSGKYSCSHWLYDEDTAQESSYRVDNESFLMREFFMKLGRDCKCVVEATGNWYWLVDLVQGLGLEILLSNPVQTKAIANLG